MTDDLSAGNDDRQRSASERVAYAIRTHILRAKLGPGDRLGREEDLAREMGVSRPTLREGLRLLSSAHLVRATKGPGGGIFVAATAEQGMAQMVSESVASMLAAETLELDEMVETRMLVEVPLAGLAAQHATADDLNTLRDIVARGRAAVEANQSVRTIDREIHRVIIQAARNRLAGAFMAWVVDVLHPSLERRIASVVVRSAVVDHHIAILEAIERGDPTAAERAMRESLLYLRDLLHLVEELEAEKKSDDGPSDPMTSAGKVAP